MTAPIYTSLPTAPARTDAPSVFATRADAFLGALATFQTEGDALGVFAEAQAAIAEAAAQDLLTTFTDFSGDVDALTANGVYKLAAGVTNAFTGAGDNDFLFNLYTDASNSVQVGYEGGAYMHMRSKVGGTWGAWGGLIASATESAEGIVQQATFTDATTGTQNTKYMTALRTKQAIDALAGGGLVFIESKDLASVATADFTGFDATKYDSYIFDFMNVIPATDSVSLLLRTSSDGGASFDAGASDYDHARQFVWSSGSASTSSSVDATAIELAHRIGSAATEDGATGMVRIAGPHLTKRTMISSHFSLIPDDGTYIATYGGGARQSSAIVDAVQFLMSSGNLESGIITMYGVVNS